MSPKSITRRAAMFAAASFLLVGCASQRATSTKYSIAQLDSTQGVVVGTVFERSVFTPYGAYFYFRAPDGERITISSGAKSGPNIRNTPPKIPQGVGSTFALQLPPGKYQVMGWALDYGRALKRSEAPPNPITFDVVAGKVLYLGRFDANRFLEVASIHDNYAEDEAYLRRLPQIAGAPVNNAALAARGWWLPNAEGKSLVNADGRDGRCEQC